MRTTYLLPTTFRKLTDERVAQIQMLWADKDWPVARLAKRFRVCSSTIRKAIKAIPLTQVSLKKRTQIRVLRRAA